VGRVSTLPSIESKILAEFRQLVAKALALEPEALPGMAKVYWTSFPVPALKGACAVELGTTEGSAARMAAWLVPGDFVLERAHAIFLKLLNSGGVFPDADPVSLLNALKQLELMLGGPPEGLAGVMFLSRTGKEGAWERIATPALTGVRTLSPERVLPKPPSAAPLRPVVVTVKPSMASHVRRVQDLAAGSSAGLPGSGPQESGATGRGSIQSIRFLDQISQPTQAQPNPASPETQGIGASLAASVPVGEAKMASPAPVLPAPAPMRPRGVSRIEMGGPIEVTERVVADTVPDAPTSEALSPRMPAVDGLEATETPSEGSREAEVSSASEVAAGASVFEVLDAPARPSVPANVAAEDPVPNEVSSMPASARHRKPRSERKNQLAVESEPAGSSTRQLPLRGLPEPSFVSRLPVKRRGRPAKKVTEPALGDEAQAKVGKTSARSQGQRPGRTAARSSASPKRNDTPVAATAQADTAPSFELESLPDETTSLFLRVAERFLGNRQRLTWSESRDANHEPFVDVLTHTKHSGVVLLVHGLPDGDIEGAAFFVQVKGTGIMRAELFKQVQALINQRALEGAAYQLKGSKFTRPKAAIGIRAVRSALSALYDDRGATQEFFPKTSGVQAPSRNSGAPKRRAVKTTTTISFVETARVDPEIVEFYNTSLVKRLGLKSLRVRMATPPPLNLDLPVSAGPALLIRRGGAAHKPFEKKLKNPTWGEVLRAIDDSIKSSGDKKSVFLEAIEALDGRIEFQLAR